MPSKSGDMKQAYEDLREQLSKLSRALKILETRALKQTFSTNELASKGRKISSLRTHKTGRGDEVALKNNLPDGLEKLERALELFREIQKQKNTGESKIQGASVGRRRKSKRCIHFDKIESDITNYKSLISEISAQADTVNQVVKVGNASLQEGRIPKNKEEKTRQELAAISIRWNVLCGDVLNTCSSIEAFVLEMQMEYSKLNLWLSNSEVADSWLMEYEPHADKPEKLGTTIRVVRLQLHENQGVLDNFRKSKTRLQNMYDIAVALMKSGRLDEEDANELERVVNVLVAKWESIDNRLNASRDRIYAEINRLRQRKAKQGHSILRRFSSKRNSSFRRKRSMRKKREMQQRKEASSQPTERRPKVSVKEVVRSSASVDLNASLDPISVVMTTNKESEEDKSRLEKQKAAFESFDSSLKSCEKCLHDLDEEQLQKFLAAGSTWSELNKQLEGIMTFEAELKRSRSEFESEVDKFEKAKEEDLFKDADCEILEKRVQGLKTRWDELMGDHVANKDRITKASIDLNNKSMQDMNKEFDKIEKQIKTPEIYDDERLSLEENILKQKRLMEDLDSYNAPIKQVNATTNNLLDRGLIDEATFAKVHEETGALMERQRRLKGLSRENGDRLATELLEFNQRENESPLPVEEETIQISDDYSMLAQSLDDLLADDISDEGFAELDSSRSFLELKMTDFDAHVQSMNSWMNDTEKLINSLHVGMDPIEVSKRVQQIKMCCEEIDKKELKMKRINKLGEEITSESLNMTTTESVEGRLEVLNKRWRETKEMLRDYSDKDEDERAEYGVCCCLQMVKKAFHACFYS
ncbi:cingulin-like [Orbicella faveolata]|uniref:cingulin-like n=1 Tax=Orbicella faveolata TaxID=48498 RepID=UPI0009E1D5CE|nr:cingulin-like [Orbicella faveolata]